MAPIDSDNVGAIAATLARRLGVAALMKREGKAADGFGARDEDKRCFFPSFPRRRCYFWFLSLAELSEAFCSVTLLRLCRRPDAVASARDEGGGLFSFWESASRRDHIYLFARVRWQLVLGDCENSLQPASEMQPRLNPNPLEMPAKDFLSFASKEGVLKKQERG